NTATNARPPKLGSGTQYDEYRERYSPFHFDSHLRKASNGLRLSGRAFQRTAPTACYAAFRAALFLTNDVRLRSRKHIVESNCAFEIRYGFIVDNDRNKLRSPNRLLRSFYQPRVPALHADLFHSASTIYQQL